MSADALLVALLDTVIPASGDMPAAGTHGLAAQVRADAAGNPLATGLDVVLGGLPADFALLDTAAREATLRSLADADADSVRAVVNLVYTAYYTNPDVLALIEKYTGYHAGPPQPRGYELPAFDAVVLSRTRQAAPSWRETP